MRRLFFLCVTALSAAPVVAQVPDRTQSLEEAQKAYVAGDYRLASQFILALLEENPDDPDLLRRLAAIEGALGNLREAGLAIDRAKDLAPGDADILLARANILFWQGRVVEAEEQAKELSQKSPSYPGLEQLEVSLRNARRSTSLRLRSLGFGGSLSEAKFASGSNQSWQNQRAITSFGWGQRSQATLQLEREERLQTDTRISATVGLPVGGHRITFTTSITPSANFREQWSLGAGGEIDAGKATRLLIDGRHAAYSEDDVTSLSLGARHKIAEPLNITARTIHIFGGGEAYRFGGALRVDFEPDDDLGLFVTVARYPDAEADGTRILRSVASGAAVRIDNRLILGLIGELDVRQASYKRSSIALDLRWDLGAAQ